MGDSDDEYNRRRGREKFMKERSDFQQDKRRDFSTGGGGERRGYMQNRGDYRQVRNSRPDSSPPVKRMRRDWDDNYDPTARREPEVSIQPPAAVAGPPVPSLMSFKQFLTTQDDSISDEDAIQKYQDYKLEFKRQLLHAFFVAHKDEEWFRWKYHPEDSSKRKSEHHAFVRRRLEVFQELWEKQRWLDKFSLDEENCRNLVKFMDAVVVKLEGGTDEDVLALEKQDDSFDDGCDSPGHRQADEKETEPARTVVTNNRKERRESADNCEVRRKRHGGEEGAISDSEASDKGSVTSAKSKSSAPPSVEAGEVAVSGVGDRVESPEPGDGAEPPPGKQQNGDDRKAAAVAASGGLAAAAADEDTDGGAAVSEIGADDEDGDEEAADDRERRGRDGASAPTSRTHTTAAAPKKDVRDASPVPTTKGDASPAKMLLHKTLSIFLRSLAPAITKSEVEALCKRFPGFLRVSLAEPIADRRFYRRGWVTFKRDVNIRDICWNLNSIRLKDCDMCPIVNRDLSKRIRVANGVLSHRQVAQNDLRLAARLVQIYDKKFNLWQDNVNGNDKNSFNASDPYNTAVEFNLTSKNPLLKNITDYLIEEASAEEEELLGTVASKSNEGTDQKVLFERNDKLLKVLDRIILYLRVVHSIDYYNHGEYPCEDEMPNRCGLIHVRGPAVPPSQFGTDEKGNTLLSTAFVNDLCKIFETHLQPLLSPKDRINEDEAIKLGKKDAEKEVEAFVNANCQELAKDKWLCPLSGKKFKGPEFVRKHVLNKHNDKLEEVRTEVLYFNNYLFDAKRPGPVDVKPMQYAPTQQSSYTHQTAPSYSSGNVGQGYSSGGGYDRGNRDFQQQSQPASQSHQQQDSYRSSGGNYASGGGGGSYSGGGYSGGGSGGGGYYRSQNDYGGSGSGGGGYRREHYQRRDFSSQGGGYSSNRGSTTTRHYQATPSDSRRDPRVPVTYTDLDAPEDVY